jgi:hypothetical protein
MAFLSRRQIEIRIRLKRFFKLLSTQFSTGRYAIAKGHVFQCLALESRICRPDLLSVGEALDGAAMIAVVVEGDTLGQRRWQQRRRRYGRRLSSLSGLID